jgi:hypothetical protein
VEHEGADGVAGQQPHGGWPQPAPGVPISRDRASVTHAHKHSSLNHSYPRAGSQGGAIAPTGAGAAAAAGGGGRRATSAAERARCVCKRRRCRCLARCMAAVLLPKGQLNAHTADAC